MQVESADTPILPPVSSSGRRRLYLIRHLCSPYTRSIWPAGIQGSAPGTVEWAGGMINWNDPDYKAQGLSPRSPPFPFPTLPPGNQFTAVVKSVSVKCGDKPPTGQNITSYVYGTNATVNTPTISFSNASTLLNGALVGVPVNARALALVTVLTFIGALMGAVV